jgi:hypothetical protein
MSTTEHPEFEKLLRQHPWFIEQLKNDDKFACAFYASLCNLVWSHGGGHLFSGSWRWNGGFVADLREKGESYMDFYCSGGEGSVKPEVEEAAEKMGFRVLPYEAGDDGFVTVWDERELD